MRALNLAKRQLLSDDAFSIGNYDVPIQTHTDSKCIENYVSKWKNYNFILSVPKLFFNIHLQEQTHIFMKGFTYSLSILKQNRIDLVQHSFWQKILLLAFSRFFWFYTKFCITCDFRKTSVPTLVPKIFFTLIFLDSNFVQLVYTSLLFKAW